ncbi:MAG: CDP-alcohol phosphatidyltransferase family protein [Clostridiales bacterium]|jgi:cardiolipin synthase|nr:CDP-alcohol phosphatidyltransferase family protein [Clostridiales bacterium]
MKNKVFTVPNIITIFRILLIPFFAVVMFYEHNNGLNMTWGLILFLLCASTDLVDGYIARRFKMVSNVGKFLDPVADKCMHITVMVCLSVIHRGQIPPFYILTIILVAKEFIMLLTGLILITKKVVVSANVYGKAAAVVLSAGVVLVFFKDIYLIGFIVSAVGVAIALAAMVIYGVMIFRQLKGRKKGETIEIDTGLLSGYERKNQDAEEGNAEDNNTETQETPKTEGDGSEKPESEADKKDKEADAKTDKIS